MKKRTWNIELRTLKKAFSYFLQVPNSKLQAQQKGFTLLLAALIASIVLSLGAAVFSIARKELALSSVGRNSQFAFYAADTAAECALYWDFRSDIHPFTFATSSDSHNAATSIKCAQNTPDPTLTVTASDGNAATSTFTLNLPQIDPNKPSCAIVTVAKHKDPVTTGIVTVIRADGFSSGCTTDLTDPQALQRSVELHY